MRPPVLPLDRLWIGTSWKMNKTRAEALAYARALAAAPIARGEGPVAFVVPPFTAVAEVAEALRGTSVAVGVQTMHWADAGAWTGEISPPMVVDVGATLVEIGHSERREHFGETDETVALKVAAAISHGLVPLVCVGDTRADHEAGRTAEVLARQVRAAVSRVERARAGEVVIAYEPVWSIGEGGTPADPAFADARQAEIKAVFREATGHVPRVLYGGSVDPGNCAALAARPNVDGLFVGRSAWRIEGYLDLVARVAG